MPVTVAADVLTVPSNTPRQVQTWYTQGRWWVAYRYGSTNYIRRLYIRSSADKVSWSDPVEVMADQQELEPYAYPYTYLIYNAGSFSVALNTTTNDIHVVHQNHLLSGSWPAVYRKGTCNADGTISWDTAKLWKITAYGTAATRPQVVLDSDGYPWIMARRTDYGGVGGHFHSAPIVYRSSTKDGTWTDAADFPHMLENVAYNIDISGALCALSDGKMLAFWYRDTTTSYYAKCKLWDGSSWGSEEDLGLSVIPRVPSANANIIRVGNTDGALMTWLDISAPDNKHAIRSCYRSPAGVLGSFKTVYEFDNTTSKSHGLTWLSLQGKAACIWGDFPVADKIYGKVWNPATDTWSTITHTILDVADTGLQHNTLTPSLVDTNGRVLLRWVNAY